MHHLSKSDYKHYLNCPESLWLLKNKPDVYPKGEFTLFAEKLVKEGYEVEEYAKQLFAEYLELSKSSATQDVLDAISKGWKVIVQPTFEIEGLLARADIVEVLEDNSLHIYEVKSSTSVKTDKKHAQPEDACFQKYVVERCGLKVSKVSIIHLNKDFVKEGEIKAAELLHVEDITERVNAIYTQQILQIKSAVKWINQAEISTSKCSCLEKTRSNHCDAFSYFNTELPKYNIYEINRISKQKIEELVLNDQFDILEIPNDFELSDKQRFQVESLRKEAPVINKKSIARSLEKLKYPLHLIDYETYASAIPKLDGLGPHQHLPFQVSIHTLTEDGSLTHFEYLLDNMEMPTTMLKEMQAFTGSTGTFISWHKSFEAKRNEEMVLWMPEYTSYLEYINQNMYDLEDIFKKDYIDYRFKGSSSIKKVLPVLIPKFTYENLPINNGTLALDTWGRMILDPAFPDDVMETRKNLLEYCELDTLAMVEIYMFLKNL